MKSLRCSSVLLPDEFEAEPIVTMKTHVPEFAVGIGTLALINAGLAQAKNRSGLGWFFASMFVGPIATLLIVVLPKLESGDTAAGTKRFDLQDYRRQ